MIISFGMCVYLYVFVCVYWYFILIQLYTLVRLAVFDYLKSESVVQQTINRKEKTSDINRNRMCSIASHGLIFGQAYFIVKYYYSAIYFMESLAFLTNTRLLTKALPTTNTFFYILLYSLQFINTSRLFWPRKQRKKRKNRQKRRVHYIQSVVSWSGEFTFCRFLNLFACKQFEFIYIQGATFRITGQ